MMPAIITTSWDDGHEMDVRLGELLARHGMKGTFYVPGTIGTHAVMDAGMLDELRRQGHECGAHTRNHVYLHRASIATMRTEIVDGKRWLEDRIQAPVTAFSYPGGHAPRPARALVREAGFLLGRCSRSLWYRGDFDPFLMPVTAQIYPHPWLIHLRHAVKEGNWSGLGQWCVRLGASPDPARLADLALRELGRSGGVLHLWGHSWEIAGIGWWDRLDALLGRLSRQPGILYLDNTATVRALGLAPRMA